MNSKITTILIISMLVILLIMTVTACNKTDTENETTASSEVKPDNKVEPTELSDKPVFDSVLNISAKDVAEIEWKDGKTGESTVIVDEETIGEIMKLLNTFEIERSDTIGIDGWTTYLLIHLHNTEEAFALTFRDDSSVEIDGETYYGKDGHFEPILKMAF